MDAKYSKIFINAWNTVLESFSAKHVTSADVRPPEKADGDRDIVVLIGMIGDIRGQVYMAMNAETGKSLASEMLGGMEITEVDELVISAVGEMCNMIMGNACSSISSADTSVDITPPTVVAGRNRPAQAIEPSYCISFVLEDREAVDFAVDVKAEGNAR